MQNARPFHKCPSEHPMISTEEWECDVGSSIPRDLGKIPALKQIRCETNVSGNIPSELGTCLTLEQIELHRTFLTGSIPSELGKLSSLLRVTFAVNSFTGSIPSEIGSCHAMEFITLISNHLAGKVPSEIGKLAKLSHITLQGNSFVGNIPSEIGHWGNLREIDIEYEKRLGEIIPTEVGNIKRLNDILLCYNNFEEIPSEIGKLTKLREFVFAKNYARGSIPEQIGNCPLNTVDLSYNDLIGSVPTEMGKFAMLYFFRLDSNSLSGIVPSELGNINEMCGEWNLKSNAFTGSIPSDLGRIGRLGLGSSVAQLKLSQNSFSGSIPTELGKLSYLYDFIAMQNRLQGSCPTELGRLHRASRLIIARNQLKGSIPTEFGSPPKMLYLDVSKNLLQGPLPTEVTRIRGGSNFAWNLLKGNLPRRIGKEIGMALHNNQFSGKMPNASAEVLFLTLHGNRLVGSMPSMTLDLPSNLWEHPAITLHGNSLSCRLPEIRFVSRIETEMDAVKLNDSISLIGNFFTGPLPNWIPDREHDSILYQSQHLMMYFIAKFASGFVIFALSLRWTVGVRIYGFIANIIGVTVSLHANNDFKHWIVSTMFKLNLLSLLAFLPAYLYGNDLHDCPSLPINLSHLSNVTAEWVVGGLFIIHYFVVFLSLRQRSTSLSESGHSKALSTCRVQTIFAWLGWSAIVILLSMPFSLYALTSCLPRDNIFDKRLGRTFFLIIHHSSAFVGSILISHCLPSIAKLYAHPCKITLVWAVMAGKIFCSWIIPAAVIVAMHENCFGLWRRAWITCQPEYANSHQFDITFLYVLPVMRTAELCSSTSVLEVFANGKCGRPLLAIFARMLSNKFVSEAFISPCIYLWRWYAHMCRSSFKSPLRFMDCPLSIFSCAYLPSQGRMNIQLSILLGSSMVWGPLIPTLQPLIILAYATRLFVFHLGASCFELTPREDEFIDSESNAKAFLRTLSVLGLVYTVSVSIHMRLHCIFLLMIGPFLILLMDPTRSSAGLTTSAEVQMVLMRNECLIEDEASA